MGYVKLAGSAFIDNPLRTVQDKTVATTSHVGMGSTSALTMSANRCGLSVCKFFFVFSFWWNDTTNCCFVFVNRWNQPTEFVSPNNQRNWSTKILFARNVRWNWPTKSLFAINIWWKETTYFFSIFVIWPNTDFRCISFERSNLATWSYGVKSLIKKVYALETRTTELVRQFWTIL